MKIKFIKNNCENNIISNHIYIFIFEQKTLLQMPVRFIFSQTKICENKKNHKFVKLEQK